MQRFTASHVTLYFAVGSSIAGIMLIGLVIVAIVLNRRNTRFNRLLYYKCSHVHMSLTTHLYMYTMCAFVNNVVNLVLCTNAVLIVVKVISGWSVKIHHIPNDESALGSNSPAGLIHCIMTPEVVVICLTLTTELTWSNVILCFTFFVDYEKYVSVFYHEHIHIIDVNCVHLLQLKHILFKEIPKFYKPWDETWHRATYIFHSRPQNDAWREKFSH